VKRHQVVDQALGIHALGEEVRRPGQLDRVELLHFHVRGKPENLDERELGADPGYRDAQRVILIE
jgi:hypothetical protein